MTIETYDEFRENWRYLKDSYLGGRFWRSPSALTLASNTLRWETSALDSANQPMYAQQLRVSYLIPHEGESDHRFDGRLKLANYINMVSPVVKAYAEGVTAKVARDLGAAAEFAEDVDRRGSDWGEYAEGVAQYACVYGVVATIVDAPGVSVEGMSEAERRAQRIAPYLTAVHPPAWAWIRCEDDRVVEFAYVTQAFRTGNTDEVELRVWYATTKDHPGGWEVRKGSVTSGTSVRVSASAFTLVESGPLPPVSRGEIPVTFAYYERDSASECPLGVSLIGDTADAAKIIYNTMSWATEINRLAAFPFLSVPLKSTGGQLDQATKAKIGPGQGLGFDSGSGAPSWVEPSGVSQKELREHCVFTFQWAMRTAGLDLAADSSAQVSSGEALRIRSRDFESRALRFAKNMRRWETATLNLFSAMAGVPTEGQGITYPKRITLPDPSEDLARALALLQAPVDIGPVARNHAVRQLIDSALSLSDAETADAVDHIAPVAAS